ncbi:A24 family peptidase [Hoeflea poritis]|uniref:Prepilin peptidase n=1 Tax=Hoeflea poritis TaxID=2993659 RepID=A0ABT4VTC0_9HYPH|nr:prepilin peptidase [Hoeflea poritis]MDA4847945.1 prepilin peptidase [Hoeflea poritis]
MIEAAIMVIFPLCLAFAALTDTLTMTIPNRVSLILLVSFAVLAPLAGMGWADYGQHFLAGLVVFAVCFALFGIGAMGGGDAKLLTATSVWFGLNMQLLNFLTYVAVFGGLLTVVLLVMRIDRFAAFRLGPVDHLLDRKQGVPYGIAIGAAALLCYPSSVMVQYALAGGN